MTKRTSKPVAPTRKKPAESAPAGAEISSPEAYQVEKPVAPTRKKPATAALHADAATIRRALDELGINVPYYSARVVGGRLELILYGGALVTWPEAASPPHPAPACRTTGGRREGSGEGETPPAKGS